MRTMKMLTQIRCSLRQREEIHSGNENTLCYCYRQLTGFRPTTYLFFLVALQPLVGIGLLIVEVSRSHSETPHSVGLGRVIGQSHRPLSDNTQHSQETGIHASSGIRTRNPKKRSTADSRLRLQGHWSAKK